MNTVAVAASPRRDRGEAAAQLVIVIPVVILLLMMGIQSALYFHAAHVAAVSAAHGAAAGSTRTGTSGAAVSAARQMAADLSARLDAAPHASVDGARASVTVVVEVPRIAPFFPRRVSRTAVEPKERFRTEAER